ncbi:acyl-homoserine-lactone synthase [Sphingomonas sp.]|jgi:acyl-homoserine lactone synthase|uniref:acyl-homoserine-lactone synthase n=1 Tax=Sphingomonas sp. TaxID=28214 RepID=UPI003564FEAB
MVQLLDTTLHDAGDAALNLMFAARKSVFVDLLRWNVPVRDGRHEIDQFDDDLARYLILLSDDGRHLASARLLPTSRPHILDTLFPALCDGEPPRGAGVWEITNPEVLTPRRHPKGDAIRILSAPNGKGKSGSRQ